MIYYYRYITHSVDVDIHVDIDINVNILTENDVGLIIHSQD